MHLILGLGNPEQRYDGTRHNVGFHMLDAYARTHGLTFREHSKFRALIAEQGSGESKVIFAKPTTYYNLSGEAAQAICDFYKIMPEQVLIVHDELALDFGTVRTRGGGSDAGNNGVKSVTQHLGPATARLRIGTNSPHPEQMSDADFVLGKFSADEATQLGTLERQSAAIIDQFINGQFVVTTHPVL